jgi:hypothetical protein
MTTAPDFEDEDDTGRLGDVAVEQKAHEHA